MNGQADGERAKRASDGTGRRAFRGRAPADIAVVLGGLSMALSVLALGCASDTYATREEARPLVPGKWHRDFLHCEDGECKDWYMVNVDRPAQLRIDVYSAAVPGLPDYVLRLEDSNRQQIAKVGATGQSPRQIRQEVDPGLYLVLVESADPNGVRLEYEILADLRDPPKPAPQTHRPAPQAPARRPPPPPPPRPEPVWVDAEVLEVERNAGEPAFVLIDAGKPKGLRPGHTGQLVENGRAIAEIEVKEVYEAGSRARIVGPLRAPITVETKAQIAVPRTER